MRRVFERYVSMLGGLKARLRASQAEGTQMGVLKEKIRHGVTQSGSVAIAFLFCINNVGVVADCEKMPLQFLFSSSLSTYVMRGVPELRRADTDGFGGDYPVSWYRGWQ